VATTLYCTAGSLDNRLSREGVDFRTDDMPPDALGDVLEEASREIDEYALLNYAEADLGASPVVAQWCTTIAAVHLCERRGNPVPGSLIRKYDKIIEKLEKVQTGALQIPEIPMRRTNVPQLSNHRIRLDPHPRSVVERSRSTGTAKNYVQHVDRLDWWDYYQI
jgi:phage gp36-like protein